MERLAEMVRGQFPALTRRDARLPNVAGKAFAVIGARRAGKTSFLWQQLRDRLEAGRPRESLLLLGLEDDRLSGMTTADLDWLLEEYFRRYPGLRHQVEVTLCLDEVQVVPEWERFVRRLLDTEKVAVVLSGSSARLLSREVATSLRGRGLEVLIHPFSFREALRHAGEEPDAPWDELGPGARSTLEYHLRAWLVTGGFPEVQTLAPADRRAVLASYVDVMMLRDVIERHGISNPHALRWLQRRLLSRPGGGFSVQEFFEEARSEGISVGKDTLHEFVAYLEDCFLIRTVSLHSGPARRRVNARRVYPIDTGLIELYGESTPPSPDVALRAAVLLELDRRGYDVGYVMTPERRDFDFLAAGAGRERMLIQVDSNPGIDQPGLEQLAAAAASHKATALLITLNAAPPPSGLPSGVTWRPAASWLLDSPAGAARVG